MAFTACLLLTLMSAGICIALPRLLFLVTTAKTKRPVTSQPVLKTRAAES